MHPALLIPASGFVGFALALPALAAWARRREAARFAREVVAGLSHDLRTPLTQILMLSEMLLLRRERSDEERERWLGVIGREARALSDRVDELVFFAHSRRSPLVVVPSPTELAPLVRDVAAAAATTAASRGMTVEVGPLADVDARVDAHALRHALLNLVANAVRFGPDGQLVRVSLEVDGPDAVLTVADQGSGIPPRDRRKVWQPFTRLRAGAGRADGGAGLGLAVVRAIVAAHGGSVEVDDAPGGGARFRVRIPRRPRATGFPDA